MPFPILGGKSPVIAAFSVTNSCRFNDGDSAYLNRDLGTPTNADRWTYSLWVKRSNIGASQVLLSGGTANDQADFILFRGTDDQLEWQMYHGTDTAKYKTTRVFRDIASWYHLVFTYDSANGTAGDRMRIYVNGVEETVFGTEENVDQNTDSKINAANQHDIGYDSKGAVTSAYFDGYMAEVVFCDGQAYAASDFGEYDDTTPNIWKPKDPSGLTFGDNGFYLDFEASGNLGNDANGGTDFTEVNLAAADQAVDTPSNNFCVMNSLDNYYMAATFSEGNCKIVTGTSNTAYNTGTFGLTAGKWYWECETDDNNAYERTGIASAPATSASHGIGDGTTAFEWGYRYNGQVQNNNSSSSYGNSYTTDDTIGVALDLDNNRIYFAKNNTWQDSGDPTDGSGAISITAVASNGSGVYFPALGTETEGAAQTWLVNFGGCPTFTIGSAASDENDYGIFEFAPPSGYLAVCSKNLGSDGG